jgi:hypothetical protein
MILENKGQTSVEYIVLLAVIVFLVLAAGAKLKSRLIGDSETCEVGDTSFKCMIINEILNSGGFGGTPPDFKHFTLRR